MERAEAMISRHVLQLDWRRKNEQDRDAAPLGSGDSYLSRILRILLGS